MYTPPNVSACIDFPQPAVVIRKEGADLILFRVNRHLQPELRASIRFTGFEAGPAHGQQHTATSLYIINDEVHADGRSGAPLRRTGSAFPGIVLAQIAPTARRRRWPTLTTAPQADVAARIFHVIHRFHPWRGRPFELVAYKSAWGEDRVYFYNHEQKLIALPASWTDVIAVDPFVAVAEGRVSVDQSS